MNTTMLTAEREMHGEHWVHVLGWLNSFIGKPDNEKRIQLNASPDAVFDALMLSQPKLG